MGQSILIIVVQADGKPEKAGLELIQKTKALAEENSWHLAALLLGRQAAKHAYLLLNAGADEAVYADSPALAAYNAACYTTAICSAIMDRNPCAVLFGSDMASLELAARTAARLHTSLLPGCTSLSVDQQSGLLFVSRPDRLGLKMDTFAFAPKKLPVISVSPGARIECRHKWKPKVSKNGTVHPFPIDISSTGNQIRLVSEEKKQEKGATDITKQPVLVAGGRGVGSKEGMRILQRLAQLLGGGVACSRACVDAGWMDAACQVGQSGKNVKPDLYLACGISGAIQHITGMEDAKLVIAINKNPNAPIFAYADLGIVGHLETILPALAETLEAYHLKT